MKYHKFNFVGNDQFAPLVTMDGKVLFGVQSVDVHLGEHKKETPTVTITFYADLSPADATIRNIAGQTTGEESSH